MAYLLDANVFIQAKNLHYGFDFCPAFWDWLDEGQAAGKVFRVQAVGDELVGGGDDLATWAQARGADLFLPPDTTVVAGLQTTSTWANGAGYEPAAVSTFLQVADYYLVGHALAQQHVVVTHEIAGNSKRKIKIPDACLSLGVKCVTPFAMLRTERALFTLGHR